jgi:pyruvate,orthophosphate dikinase
MPSKYVYLFEEGNAGMKNLLGGKGSGLAEMTRIGLPVPPGFTITTEACNEYNALNKNMPPNLEDQVKEALQKTEKKLGKAFGDKNNPLLVSVRSGARVSMPGMMDTILNLGLNDETVLGLAKHTKNERFAFDAYRRLIQMFSGVVLGVPREHFEEILEHVKRKKGVKLDTELDAQALKEIIDTYKALVLKETGQEFPRDPWRQLRMAILAVFNSWNNQRAIVYRKTYKIPENWGTAVNVQVMVFGNMGVDSGTGVAFTRNPSTGEKKLYGEYLMNAQGEDVVAGIRTPKPISALKDDMPSVFEQFLKVCETLEKHYRDLQDMEFTIEKGKLYMLQTRNGKRTAAAAVKAAVDMADEGLITQEDALLRVNPTDLNQLLHKSIDPKAKLQVIARGLPASPGAAAGEVVFDADTAEKMAHDGHKVLLVRPETAPDDIHGMIAAQGILTSRGGLTSHAAVVARGMGKTCVVGCEELRVDLKAKKIFTGLEVGKAGEEIVVKEGDFITIDGSTGNVILGQTPMIEPQLSGEFKKLLSWADRVRRLRVRANADLPRDAEKAFELGAEGVGLCRTEHMFFAPDRLPIVQEMILAESEAKRREALKKLLPFQRSDFIGIFKAMRGFPVTIRLIDPPLHEFLPSREELLVETTTLRLKGEREKLFEREALLKRVNQLHETNPMLGLRGCRLGILYPEIFEMQAQAIFEAAAHCIKEGLTVKPEVMIPLVGHVNELKVTRETVERMAKEVIEREGVKMNYSIGTMIELPRAALTADEIAEYAEFFSFGTNDLTQTTFGFSRDDAEGKFLGYYIDKKLLSSSPFAVLDRLGVGKLMRMAVELGRGKRANLKCGICGEHGGDPSSVEFCHQIGLDYVSCSPYRVPIARLAAAQAVVNQSKGTEAAQVSSTA